MSETSKSIADWQQETFGTQQVATNMACREAGGALNAALADAQCVMSADVPRPNLSRAIRAAKELAELISLLATDDNAVKAPEECSDIEIVLAGIYAAHWAERQEVTDAKMARNRQRQWQLTGDGHGQHVKTKGDGL